MAWVIFPFACFCTEGMGQQTAHQPHFPNGFHAFEENHRYPVFYKTGGLPSSALA